MTGAARSREAGIAAGRPGRRARNIQEKKLPGLGSGGFLRLRSGQMRADRGVSRAGCPGARHVACGLTGAFWQRSGRHGRQRDSARVGRRTGVPRRGAAVRPASRLPPPEGFALACAPGLGKGRDARRGRGGFDVTSRRIPGGSARCGGGMPAKLEKSGCPTLTGARSLRITCRNSDGVVPGAAGRELGSGTGRRQKPS